MENMEIEGLALSEYLFDMKLDFLMRDGTLVRSIGRSLALPSGTAGTWICTLRFLADTLPEGTTISLDRYAIQMAHIWQTEDPKRRDYLTVECTGNVKFAIEPYVYRDCFIKLTIDEGKLTRGDEIVLRLGDCRWGGAGSEVYWTTTQGRLRLELEDQHRETPIAEDAHINVLWRDEPKTLRLLGPTIATPGEPFAVNLIVFDSNSNVIESAGQTIRLNSPEGISGLPEKVTFAPEDKGIRILENISIARPGIYRIGVCLEDGSLSARSNPIVCQKNPEQRIYWGELHAHGWGDSEIMLMCDRIPKLDPAGRHDQARRVGRYDYGAPSAMSMPDTPDREKIWQAYIEAFDKNDEPGTYVPFLAMEMHPRPGGDWTLVLRDHAELPPSIHTPVSEIFKCYGSRNDAILEGHLGGATPEYAPFRPEHEQIKMIEVASAFGGAEWILQEALQLGYHPAITGASDLHLGLMGAPRAVETFRGRFYRSPGKLNVRDSGFGSGPVGAVMTQLLTRETVWNGIMGRRTYATTGDRIYLHLDAGGHGMGEIAELPESFEIELVVHAQTNIEQIDLVVGDKLADTVLPGTDDYVWALTFDRNSMPKGKWFYFRIEEANNEYAWTAPVWFAGDESLGDDSREWPAWNFTEPPKPVESDAMKKHLGDLVAYLETEGDRDKFGNIMPIKIAHESMGTSALFTSTWESLGYPVTIRWFFEYDIPKLRVDYGYRNFGVVDCQRGPAADADF